MLSLPKEMVPTTGKIDIPMQEFFFETARVVSNLFLSGTMKRSPNIKLILPHLGGAFPPLVPRWTGFSGLIPGPWTVSGSKFQEVMNRQIWFDMSGFAFPNQMKILLKGLDVPHTRMLYGSDWPFVRASGVEELRRKMDREVQQIFTGEGEIRDLYFGNAERLFGCQGLPSPMTGGDGKGEWTTGQGGQEDEVEDDREEKEFLDRVRDELELREQDEPGELRV